MKVSQNVANFASEAAPWPDLLVDAWLSRKSLFALLVRGPIIERPAASNATATILSDPFLMGRSLDNYFEATSAALRAASYT
jgi:hypothetical protein